MKLYEASFEFEFGIFLYTMRLWGFEFGRFVMFKKAPFVSTDGIVKGIVCRDLFSKTVFKN